MRPIYRQYASFTIVELMIVVIMIGVLASLAMPQFVGARERALNREARALCSLLYEAEKMRRAELDNVVGCSGYSDCASALGIDISASSGWNIRVHGINTSASPQRFNATVTRNGSDGRWWAIHQSSSEPFCGGSGARYCL
jgi:type II secretory pathway pseudopilin PulG